jgi:tyrosine-protein phosphatase SIW14
MSHPNRRKLLILVASLISAASGYFAWDCREYWFANNFREVVPGKIYAGGYQHPLPLRRIIKQYGIKTVLSLRDGNDPFETREIAELESCGVAFKKIVIPYQVPDSNRIVVIEQAVDFIANEANQPVYVHCWAGYHRTGAVVAIYRVRDCQWDEGQAHDELERWGGTAQGSRWPARILNVYCTRARDRLASHCKVRDSDF